MTKEEKAALHDKQKILPTKVGRGGRESIQASGKQKQKWKWTLIATAQRGVRRRDPPMNQWSFRRRRRIFGFS